MFEPRSVAEVLGGAKVLGRTVTSVAELGDAVEQGLPKAALRAVVQHLYPDLRQRRAALHRIVPEATFKRRGERLSLIESERTERLARVTALAETVWGDPEQARRFLTRPHALLQGRAPADAAATDLGARQVEDILYGLAYGLPV